MTWVRVSALATLLGGGGGRDTVPWVSVSLLAGFLWGGTL